MPSIRTFIAIPTPADVKDALSLIQAELRSANADIRWESSEKLHITLRFLGDVEYSRIQQLIKECSETVCYLPSFSLIYGGLGCFPDMRNPRLVWAGSENTDGVLMQMKQKIDEVVAHFGFEAEKRSFHPHITLGRVKGNRNILHLIKKLQSVTFEAHAAVIGELYIMKSELRPTGSVYTLQQSIPLRSANG